MPAFYSISRQITFMKVSIIGAGHVGSATAFSLLHLTEVDELVLLDIRKELALGEALDLQQASTGLLKKCKVIAASDYSKLKGSDVIVIAAGVSRKKGQTREQLLGTNERIIDSIISRLPLSGKEKLLILTSPIDQLTLKVFRKSGLPRKQVIGVGCLLDTFRLRTILGNPNSKSFVFAQHGELASLALRGKDKAGINAVKEAGDRILALKGYTGWAPAVATARTVRAIVEDTREVMPVSCVLDGEFGLRDVAVTVPAVIGARGIVSIETTLLTKNEKERLRFIARELYSTV